MVKNTSLRREKARAIKENGFLPIAWVVLQDAECSMIVRNRFTGEVKLIEKQIPLVDPVIATR